METGGGAAPCEGRVRFDGDHPLFADHFPGAPVVPGTLVMRFFCETAPKCMPGTRAAGVRRFRFRRFVAPGEYGFSLEAQSAPGGETFARCTLRDNDGTILASGQVLLKGKGNADSGET